MAGSLSSMAGRKGAGPGAIFGPDGGDSVRGLPGFSVTGEIRWMKFRGAARCTPNRAHAPALSVEREARRTHTMWECFAGFSRRSTYRHRERKKRKSREIRV
jgi:hypothetical protein